MMPALPTVKVQNPAEEGGFMIINKSDFDPNVHKLFVETEATAQRLMQKAEKTIADIEAEATAEAKKFAKEAAAKIGWGKAPPPSAES